MNKTIGILAHVDAGKTTFCEQILYHTKAIRKLGRVDHKDTFLDSHSIEKSRGITIFSGQGNFTYKDSNYYLIDTPGHIDFSPEMERAIKIMDYAIVIVSGIERVQSHTKTAFRLLKEYEVPTFIFVNKMDRVGADKDKVIKDLKSNLSENIIDISNSFNIEENHELDNNLIEFIAERDDDLFEKYLEEKYEKELWIDSIRKMIKDSKIYPCSFGSALNNIGIDSFLDKIHMLTYTNYYEDGEFIGKVYKITNEENKKTNYLYKIFKRELISKR